MSLEYIVTWMMVFLRTLGVILQLPMVANRPLPVTVRIGLCVCLTTLMTGLVPLANVPPTLWALLLATAGEVLLGLAMGFVGRMAFEAVEMAGRMMTTEIGLSATPGMGVPEPSSEPMASLVSTLAVVLFFMFGGHLAMIAALQRSFTIAPAAHPMLGPGAAEMMIVATAHLIELGLRIAAPFIAMNFMITLAFATLGKIVPKMNPFMISFSMRIFAGFALLGSAGGLLARYLYMEFDQTPWRMLELLGRS